MRDFLGGVSRYHSDHVLIKYCLELVIVGLHSLEKWRGFSLFKGPFVARSILAQVNDLGLEVSIHHGCYK